MAVEEEKRGQYALAIQHYMASKDYQRVAKVTDQMMQNYIQNDGLDLEDTLSAIPIFSVPNENVEFLRSYAKFHREFKVYYHEWVVYLMDILQSIDAISMFFIIGWQVCGSCPDSGVATEHGQCADEVLGRATVRRASIAGKQAKGDL